MTTQKQNDKLNNMPNKKAYRINILKKRFHKEWLLIEVSKIDTKTTTPTSGYLITHSPQRQDVYKKAMKLEGKKPLLIEFSEDKLPKGFAAA